MIIKIFNMVRLQVFCGMILIIALAMSGCNDAPTQVGMDFLRDTISIEIVIEQEDETIIPNAYSYSTNLPEANSGGVLIGIHNGLRAAAMMRFNTFIPESIREKIINGIVECKLYLYPQQYAFGDTVANYLAFEVKEVTSFWFYDETTNDDVFNSENLFIGSRKIGKWKGNIERKDTMDAIEIDFPLDICVDWVEKFGDGLNIPDEDINWGIAIFPKSESTMINRFRGLNNFAASQGSYIKIIYYKDDEKDELDTFELRTAIECTFIESNENNNSDDLIVQGGVRIHSKIDFDISEIPLFACVHYAELTLTLDETKSYSEVEPSDSIALFKFRDTTLGKGERYGASKENVVIGEYDSTSKTIVFKNFLSIPLNNFLRRDEGKGSLVLAFQNLGTEANSLTKYVFHGINAADTSKRPKIKIVYSLP
jgi:hypothetical protein